MEGIVPILIWLVLAMIALGLLVILVFGLKGLASGKHRPWSIGAMLLPLAIFGIAYALNAGSDTPAAAAVVLTAVILIAIGIVAVVITGLKGFLGL